MNARPVLQFVGALLRRCAAAVESRIATPEPPPLDPEEQLRLAREQQRKERRAARTRWYQRRPVGFEVPESLKYYEAIHGTRKTIEMLKKVARKLDD